MKIGVTSDTPSWSKVSDITKELRNLAPLFESKYAKIDWELFVCIRCLPNEIGRKSSCRFSKKDVCFFMDITVDESEFVPLKKDKDGQRLVVGKAFFVFFEEKIRHYKKKLPGLELLAEELIADVRQWCITNKWLCPE